MKRKQGSLCLLPLLVYLWFIFSLICFSLTSHIKLSPETRKFHNLIHINVQSPPRQKSNFNHAVNIFMKFARNESVTQVIHTSFLVIISRLYQLSFELSHRLWSFSVSLVVGVKPKIKHFLCHSKFISSCW